MPRSRAPSPPAPGRRLAWLHAGCLIAVPLLAAGLRAAPPRPHIVVLLADDLGWKDVGYHGSEIETPHIDRLAASGVRLERFYVQPVCSPTRSALMTGRYPIRHGLQVGVIWPWADWGLPVEERTLPQALKDAGYRTVALGKWHLGMQRDEFLPRARGFDHHYGHYLGAIDYFTHRRDGGLDWHRDGKPVEEDGYTTELIAREAVRVVEAHDESTPLLLYVAFNAPHSPLQAPERYLRRYEHLADRKRRAFAAMVNCLDDAIGRIDEALARREMRDDTLLIFASDNGGPTRNGARNGELRGHKGTLYEGGIRVPAFAVWPGKLQAGRVLEESLHVTDLYPTLLKLAGATLEQSLPIDGTDAWPSIADGTPHRRDEILHNLEPNRGAIRVGPWKLVRHRGGKDEKERIELFDVVADPGETKDLAAAHPEKAAELQRRLERYACEAVPAKGAGRNRPRGFQTPAVWAPQEQKPGAITPGARE